MRTPPRCPTVASPILVAAFIALLPACGSSPGSTSQTGVSQGPTTGSLVFTSSWEPPPAAALAAPTITSAGSSLAPLAAAVDICVDYGIDTVSMQVLSGTTVVAESSFPCGAHAGTLNDVPAGSNLVVRLQGSVGGNVLWRGNSDNAVTVSPGRTTDAGKITVGYIGNDNVAPTIVSVSPDNNATNVPNASTLRLQFSERMAINTVIDNASILIVDNASLNVPGTVGYNGTDNSAVFTPAAPFASGGRYTLMVSPVVTDMAGRPLPGPYVSNFTAHTAGTFVRPALIENYDGVSTSPLGVVGDSLGNVLVVGAIRGTPALLWDNRFDAAGKQWGVSARVPKESFAPLAMGAAKVVSDNTGNALLLFEYTMNNLDLVLVAKEYDSVLGWDRNNTLLASAVKSAQVPNFGVSGGHVDIASDGIGNAIAVWVTSASGVDSLWARRFLPGVGWEPAPVQLAFTTEAIGYMSFPKVAMNSRGDAVVAWAERGNTYFLVRAIRYTPGAGWEGSISDLDNTFSYPSVVVDGDGNGLALWRREAGGQVVANRYASGQGWEGPAPISGTDLVPGSTLMDVGVDGAGRVVALWADSSVGSPFRLKARRFLPGTGWGADVVVAVNVAGRFDYSVNAAGQGVVAFYGAVPALNVSAVRYDGNSDSWGSVLTVDDSNATGMVLMFTYVDPSGIPYVVWGKANNDPPDTFATRVE